LGKLSVALTGSVVAGLVLHPAQALADAFVRFVHAVPGAPSARLSAGTGGALAPLGTEPFAGATPYRDVPAGTYDWSLNAASGGKLLAKGAGVPFSDGSWTLVATAKGNGVQMLKFRDQRPRKGVAVLRVIHAAPELGAPTLMIDSRTVARNVPFAKATPYLPLRPGTYRLSAVAPSNRQMVVQRRVTVKAGQAMTAIVMGSRGASTRVVTVLDDGSRSGGGRAGANRGGGGNGAPGGGSGERGGEIVVHPGDSLWSIASRRLGEDASPAQLAEFVDRLWARNAHYVASGRPDLIPVGARLTLP
jgi:hypothetical protein